MSKVIAISAADEEGETAPFKDERLLAEFAKDMAAIEWSSSQEAQPARAKVVGLESLRASVSVGYHEVSAATASETPSNVRAMPKSKRTRKSGKG